MAANSKVYFQARSHNGPDEWWVAGAATFALLIVMSSYDAAVPGAIWRHVRHSRIRKEAST